MHRSRQVRSRGGLVLMTAMAVFFLGVISVLVAVQTLNSDQAQAATIRVALMRQSRVIGENALDEAVYLLRHPRSAGLPPLPARFPLTRTLEPELTRKHADEVSGGARMRISDVAVVSVGDLVEEEDTGGGSGASGFLELTVEIGVRIGPMGGQRVWTRIHRRYPYRVRRIRMAADMGGKVLFEQASVDDEPINQWQEGVRS